MRTGRSLLERAASGRRVRGIPSDPRRNLRIPHRVPRSQLRAVAPVPFSARHRDVASPHASCQWPPTPASLGRGRGSWHD
jgi:hypothetical protein